MGAKNYKTPVTVISGFLGSGKTTLLTKALKDPAMRNSAVLVNEFGKVGLDHHLLEYTDENTILLGGGCICCTMRNDLVNGLTSLLDRMQRGDIAKVERVIIETTGLADPAPILFTILANPMLQHHFFVDIVIVTVDAVNGHLHLDRHPESAKQAAVADKIIITKTDIADPNLTQSLVARLSELNPTAQIIFAVQGEIEARLLLDSDRKGVPAKELVRPDKDRCILPDTDKEHHLNKTRSISITFDQPLDWVAFGLWLSMLLYTRGEDVLRVKGLIDVGEAGPVVLNGVQHIIHPPEHMDHWPDDNRRSRIIFIMKSIDPRDVFNSLLAFQHVLGATPIELEIV